MRFGNKISQALLILFCCGWLQSVDAPPQENHPAAAVLVSANQDLDPKAIPALRTTYNAAAADWESGAIAYVRS